MGHEQIDIRLLTRQLLWEYTIQSTVRGSVNTEKPLDNLWWNHQKGDCALIGELRIPTMYMVISNKMYAMQS